MPGTSGIIASNLSAGVIMAFLCLNCQATVADENRDNIQPVQVLRIPHVVEGTNPIYDYATTLLAMALEVNAETYGAVRLHANSSVSVQERQLRNLNNRLLDVTWSVTSVDRERHYLPIRIPLVDGFFGKRVLLISKNDTRFNLRLDASQLKSMYALQGYDWPDSRILRHNNYKVIEAPYAASFKLLIEGFADYYPRSLLEVSFELEKWQSQGIALESYLLITYPSAMYFFVSKSNTALAERIEHGLRQLVREGTLSALLHDQPFYQQGKRIAKGRHEILLENPLLSAETRDIINTPLPFRPDPE